MNFPKIDNAPGHKLRKIKAGFQVHWRARADIVRMGYPLKGWRIWQSTPEHPVPTEAEIEDIREKCQALQAEMLLYARDGLAVNRTYDATWGSLVMCYRTDPDSPYHKGEYVTRRHYDTLCRVIDRDIGAERITDTDMRRILRLYDQWTEPAKEGGPRKIAMGHAMITMVRSVLTFGKTLLKCPACTALRSDLEDRRFKAPKPREVHLSAEQVIAIRRQAHKMEKPYRHSIALAQAFQFDVASGMRQKDIIGEWVPISEPGVSDVIQGNNKWLKGIRGEEIDENFILRHVTSKRKKLLVADLKLAPMVMEEIRLLAGASPAAQVTRDMLPRSGPIIINEQTGVPYETTNFRKAWREIANAVGVPPEIRNMDSRAGAITEALASGAPLEAVRKGATHSSSSMTARYSRGDQDAAATVMQHRATSRKPKE